MAEEIKLTLDPFGEETAKKMAEVAASAEETEQKLIRLNEMTAANLTEAERQTVAEFAGKIDITDTAMVLHYGAGTQQKLAEFSDGALQTVRTQQLGEAGDMVSKLVGELKTFNSDVTASQGFFAKLFRGARKNLAVLQSKYDKVSNSVDGIVTVLEGHEVTLTKDIAVLDKLYEQNLVYFKELSMYILAGKQRLELERTTTLKDLETRAKESGLPEDAQKAKDFRDSCDRFEKRIYDLELSRMVSLQMGPQIRLVQNNDSVMTEKIQSTIVNTIPLWKSQMLITLGLAHSEQALSAEKKVADMTNELLKKNAEKLHTTTVEIAREAERGIIDIETLTATNQQLISTLDEVAQIKAEGHEKRVAAEAELARCEDEIKKKLLEIRS